MLQNIKIMVHSNSYKPRIFKGAGILLGFLIGSAVGIAFVKVTGVMGLIGAITASVAFPSGLYFERKFQRNQSEKQTKGQKTYLLLVFSGVVLFLICLFIVNLF